MLEAIAWIGFSVLVGRLAMEIGRSFWLGYILGLVLSPLIGFIIILLIRRKT